MLLRLLSFLLVFSLPAALQAQQAPDFSVTDLNGSTHALYTDYLDQGKVVILGFFYDGAPMIDALYPLLQDYAYTEWEQNLPLGVLLMSGVDSHSNLTTFAQEHYLSLPLTGTDGGAQIAMSGFIDGTFGPFFGYPMFVVIGPTGEVIFDPWGSNYEDIIATLDAAVKMLLTGAVNVEEATRAPLPTARASAEGIRIETPPGQGESQISFRLYDLQGRLLEDLRLPAGYSGIHPWPGVSSKMIIATFETGHVRVSEKLVR